MIIGLVKELAGWFLSLTEVGLVIATVLLIGLIVGMTSFWVLSRFLGKVGGAPTELDPYERELDGMSATQVVSIRPDEDSPPSELEG